MTDPNQYPTRVHCGFNCPECWTPHMEVCEIDGEIKARCTNNDCGHTRDVTESMKRDYRAEIENLKGVTQDV